MGLHATLVDVTASRWLVELSQDVAPIVRAYNILSNKSSFGVLSVEHLLENSTEVADTTAT